MQFRLPEIGEGVYEAELVGWLVQPGELVRHGRNLVEVLTDKATMEVPAPFEGTVTELLARPGQKVKVGDVLLSYTPAGEMPDHAAQQSNAVVPPAEPRFAPPAGQANGGTTTPREVPHLVRAAPSVRLLARKLGIDLTQIRGSGPGGRILMDDLSARLRRQAPEELKPPEPRPDYGTPGTRIPLAGIRRRIAEHLVHAKRTAPHYSYVDECDVTALVRLRDELKETYARAGIKLTYLAFFVKAVVAALKQVPIVNASLDDAAGEIILHDRYHIGVAVATPSGLIVPVVKDADRKGLTEIAQTIETLSHAARNGKVRLEDLRGGTFTITSVGNIGGLFSTPVLNHPEVGILGLGRITRRPVFDAAGKVRPADLMYLSFTFDHRVVDGAVGAAFGNAVIERIQKPALLLLPEKL